VSVPLSGRRVDIRRGGLFGCARADVPRTMRRGAASAAGRLREPTASPVTLDGLHTF